jgi:transposase
LAYRKLDSEIVGQVLARWQRGESGRSIARSLGVDRKTVGRWLTSAGKLALPADRALTYAEVVAVISRARKPTSPREPSAEWLALGPHREQITAWVKEPRALPLSIVHTMLVRDHGVRVSYATLRRFAIRELGWSRTAMAAPPPVVAFEMPAPPSGVRLANEPECEDELSPPATTGACG